MPALPTSIGDVQSAAASRGAVVPGPPAAGAGGTPAPQASQGPARGTVVTPPPPSNVTPPPQTGGVGPGGARGGGVMSFAPQNKGYSGSPMAMAKGGPVLGRTSSFVKSNAIPKTQDQFSGGRMPTKESAPSKQAYGKGK